MNQVEQRKAAKAFASFWQGKGDEVSDTQTFWLTLLRDVLGELHPEQAIQFEKRVKLETRRSAGLDKKGKVPMEHYNIGEFNRGQSSKLIRV